MPPKKFSCATDMGRSTDEIAATAGRSKGAVYTHFKSKEDLFLVSSSIGPGRTSNGLWTACESAPIENRVWQHFVTSDVGLVHERAWSILTLEFKLFALRHPQSKERLRKAF